MLAKLFFLCALLILSASCVSSSEIETNNEGRTRILPDDPDQPQGRYVGSVNLWIASVTVYVDVDSSAQHFYLSTRGFHTITHCGPIYYKMYSPVLQGGEGLSVGVHDEDRQPVKPKCVSKLLELVKGVMPDVLWDRTLNRITLKIKNVPILSTLSLSLEHESETKAVEAEE
eukprot:PhF_6_TR38933/c0_g1_i3/m.58250